jgi:hypothetical protein
MPDDLWSDAVSVARTEGVYGTCKAVGLRYESLKSRLAAAGQPGLAAAPEFVEVCMAPSPGGRGETVVELVNQHGDRMRVSGAVDVVGVVRVFCGRQP